MQDRIERRLGVGMRDLERDPQLGAQILDDPLEIPDVDRTGLVGPARIAGGAGGDQPEELALVVDAVGRRRVAVEGAGPLVHLDLVDAEAEVVRGGLDGLGEAVVLEQGERAVEGVGGLDVIPERMPLGDAEVLGELPAVEAVGHHLVEAEAEDHLLHPLLGTLPGGLLNPHGDRRQGERQLVVAGVARQLLVEVFPVLDVPQAARGHPHRQLLRPAGGREAVAGEALGDLGGGERPVEVGADPVGAERDHALGVAPVAGHSHSAMMGAGPGLQQVRHPAGAHQRQRGVAAALEAGRGVGGEAQPAGALAHRDRIEGSGFEQQPAAAGGRLGVLAADHPRDAEDLLVVGDHHDPLVEGDAAPAGRAARRAPPAARGGR